MTEFCNGRFVVEKSLGRGAQGEVYLARDSRLDRLVAIKLLHADENESCRDEARMVSRLQHPNIVTLFDVFSEKGRIGLVFEYVEGETLARRLSREGALSPVAAVELMLGILEGLAAAHAAGVIHRDIKPQNIILDSSSRARIMDFGVAQQQGTQKFDLTGTAAYMAPELLKNMPIDAHADIFAAGMMLYQLLTGKLAVESDSTYSTLYRIANENFRRLADVRPGIDDRLDHLVMVALCKEPRERFQDAQAMHDALNDWLESSVNLFDEDGKSRHSTLDFLLRRMSHTADFPALSQVISAINRINNADSERLQSLSQVILRDFSLTNKLLRVVNSATYGQFGGAISTVSHAIVILGFDNIRNLAITLLLFEHMQNKRQANTLREATLHSFFGGLLASRLGQQAGWRDVEELLICGMFQHLGRLLTIYYFDAESLEIAKRQAHTNDDEETAARAVLGMSYRDLAIGVAHYWNFPERVVNSMRPMDAEAVHQPQTQPDRLRVFSNMATDLLPVLEQTAAVSEQNLARIVKQYMAALSWSPRECGAFLKETAANFLNYLSLLGVDKTGSDFCRRMQKLSGGAATTDSGRGHGSNADELAIDSLVADTELIAADQMTVDVQQSSTALLASGVQEITNLLVSQFNLNDLLRMTLETMYRGIGFDHVLFCSKDVSLPAIVARIGFGEKIQEIIPSFRVPLGGLGDVFQLALARNADIYIEDIEAESIRDRVPQWYRKLVPVQTFIIFPLILDKKAVGFFYGDRHASHTLQITPEQINLLKTLRNQALLAIRQKQGHS